jgi:hypothetical protein
VAVVAVAIALPVVAFPALEAAGDDPVTTTIRPPAAEAVRADMRVASRSGVRVAEAVAKPRPVKAADPVVRLRPRWTTTRLNLWSGPGEGSKLLKVMDIAAKVQVTGTVRGPWAQIQGQGEVGWVRKAYLAARKPRPTVSHVAPPQAGGSTAKRTRAAGVSGAPCPDGTSVENGLQPNTVRLYRAVCAAFPAVSAWGGRSGSGGNHGAGRALDIMCTGSLGDAIAAYVRSNASRFGVSEVIWARRIWTVQRSSEGWRPMEDRGSTTANHYDHVHVSLY